MTARTRNGIEAGAFGDGIGGRDEAVRDRPRRRRPPGRGGCGRGGRKEKQDGHGGVSGGTEQIDLPLHGGGTAERATAARTRDYRPEPAATPGGDGAGPDETTIIGASGGRAARARNGSGPDPDPPGRKPAAATPPTCPDAPSGRPPAGRRPPHPWRTRWRKKPKPAPPGARKTTTIRSPSTRRPHQPRHRSRSLSPTPRAAPAAPAEPGRSLDAEPEPAVTAPKKAAAAPAPRGMTPLERLRRAMEPKSMSGASAERKKPLMVLDRLIEKAKKGTALAEARGAGPPGVRAGARGGGREVQEMDRRGGPRAGRRSGGRRGGREDEARESGGRRRPRSGGSRRPRNRWSRRTYPTTGPIGRTPTQFEAKGRKGEPVRVLIGGPADFGDARGR